MILVKRVGLALAAGFVVGAVGFGFTLVPVSSFSPATSQASDPSNFKFGRKGVNPHGETFGPLNGFDSPPDLFEAAATNGKIGYVRWTDFWDVMKPPSSPAQALTMKQGVHALKVYAEDGTSIVGEYLIVPGTVGPNEK